MIEFELPYPPSNNTYYRNYRGRTILSKDAKEYHAINKYSLFRIPKFGDSPVRLEIELYPPDYRIRDSDNPLKAIFDTLEKSKIIDNDFQIVDYNVKRFLPIPNGMIIIRIGRLEMDGYYYEAKIIPE